MAGFSVAVDQLGGVVPRLRDFQHFWFLIRRQPLGHAPTLFGVLPESLRVCLSVLSHVGENARQIFLVPAAELINFLRDEEPVELLSVLRAPRAAKRRTTTTGK